MPRQAGVPILELAFAAWPEADRRLWQSAFRAADNPFDDCGCAAHLAPASRCSLGQKIEPTARRPLHACWDGG
jgi:hypothetical protein